MLRRARYFLVSLLTLVVIQTQTATVQLNSNTPLNTNAIDAYIASKMRFLPIPGVAVAIVKDDEIVYLKGYGEADSSGRPVTPQTPFIIGSITKSLTALAVMQLVEAGKVELDAPVQKYIPWFRVADANASPQITVRQMLHQTSGLPMLREPQFSPAQDTGALERTVRSLAHAQLSYPLGQGHEYSNANYDTLGLLVQTVSGESYEEYVKQQIFAPLDMKNSFASQEEAQAHGMAVGHRRRFGIPVAVTFPYSRSELPAGYLISSAEDMAHYIIAEMNGGRYKSASVLSREGIALTQAEPAPNAYAMGWEHADLNGHHLVCHDGGTPNFQTSLFFDPEARVGVFVAANVMSALDAVSSPHGAEPLDGLTVRGMAQTILSLATNGPLPDQGLGLGRLYLIYDLAIAALTALLVVSVVRLRGRYKLSRRREIENWSRRRVFKAVTHFALLGAVIYLALRVPFWRLLVMFQPDFCYWLTAVAVVLFVKGGIEITLMPRETAGGG